MHRFITFGVKMLRLIYLITIFTFTTEVFSQSSGTGFFVSKNGYIVTCYHVIDEADNIFIRNINGNAGGRFKASVVAVDKANDLAILKVNQNIVVPHISYGLQPKQLDVGEVVFTLGYPLRSTMGDEIKLTNGIVSSGTGFMGEKNSYQLTVPIQPGNSGGPLFDKNGNVFGVVNALHVNAQNASYAIKSKFIFDLLRSIPGRIPQSNTNQMVGWSLVDQVKVISNSVVIIETETILKPLTSKVNNSRIKSIYNTSGELKARNFNLSFIEGAEVKSFASQNSAVIEYLESDSYLSVTDKVGLFWEVNYKGRDRYISTAYVRKQGTKVSSTAIVRDLSSPGGNEIRKFEKGSTVYLLGKDYGYWKINYRGTYGFVSESNLELSNYIYDYFGIKE